MKTNDIQVRGLTRRWLIDIIGVVVVVVIIVQIICSIAIYNYYYDSVRRDIKSRITMSMDFIESKGVTNDSEFELESKNLMSDYLDKSTLEIQVLDRNGDVIVSSQGFLPKNRSFADYNAACSSSDGIGEWIGKTDAKESVMAMTAMIPASGGEIIGAMRFVVSMDKINANIMYNILLIFCICLFVIAVTVISGTLFLRSIIVPIRAITDAAFRIASGKFDDRLPVKDADEIGKLCDTINYMAAELSSTEQLKNEFISSVSHELRTPLTVIKGWGETVKSSIGTNDRELVERGINVIINESERLSGLVEDLLDFSRMQSGRFDLKMQKVDVLAELGEAVYMYKDIASRDGVTIEYIEPEILPPVMADPSRLKQVFINIIDNAIKYSGKGGQVLVVAAQHDIYVQVTVKDTGCGIAAEDLSRVKEKFYKANTSVRGSGIGLAIADELIKQHNGILEIDSKQGAGTTVSIILPFIKPNDSEKGLLND